LNYDTNVLTANASTAGNLLGTDVLTEPGSGIATPGKVKFGVARTSTNPAVPVNDTLVTVQFQVKSNALQGASNQTLANVNLMSSATTAISNPQINNGQVNITGTAPSAPGGAKVSVHPSTQNTTPGATFSIDVKVDSGSSNLQSASIELNYDTNVLTANASTAGNLLGTDVLTEPGSGIATPGKVKFGQARTSTNPAATVNGTFVTVQFMVKSNAPKGVSILDLMNVTLMSSAATAISDVLVNDGQVNVVDVIVEPDGVVLSPGWNFISVPHTLVNSTVANTLQGVNYSVLFGWDPVGKMWTSPVTSFEPLKGYLIKVNETQEITNLQPKSGPFVPPSVGVIQGWNLIGTSGTVARNTETMLGAIDPSYYSIWNWNAATQAYDVAGINGQTGILDSKLMGTDVFTMEPGKGYWVWAIANTTLPALSP
jgi:hypothetical protein